jgi:uncharacterized repeat protein (TIGR02543 family)
MKGPAMKQRLVRPLRIALPFTMALCLFTAMLISTPTAWASGALGNSQSSVKGRISRYTITYDGNGNSGGNAPASTIGLGHVTLANRGSLLKSGFIFINWATHANGSGASYAEGSSYNLTANITLYSHWSTRTVPYIISFDGNGNTGGSTPSPTSVSGPITLPNNPGLLVKSGYGFIGWNTQANGLGTPSTISSPFTPTANITLFARWVAFSCALGGPCVIGDTGPGGGTVFYVSQAAFTSVGSPCNSACHYLEAAPNTWSSGHADPLKAWAITAFKATSLLGTSSAIGTGLANSNHIVSQGNNSTTAAGAARAYHGGNKQDWYLPSQFELNEMNLHYSTVGGLVMYSYWSSTQYLANRAWCLFISANSYCDAIKSDGFYVRPVRAF